MIHTTLLALCLLTLRVLPNPVWQPKPLDEPVWHLLGALATSVGLPYALLSSTSPLLQSWYIETRQNVIPYRYFALSNAGSLIALLSYPILIEPYLSGRQQAVLWSAAFVVFAVCCAVTAVYAAKMSRTAGDAFPESKRVVTVVKSARWAWLSLAACASALLLAVTNLLTQNVAPVPLFWVLPLSIYLLTFILCFESQRWYNRSVFLPLVLPAIGCLIATTGPLENRDIGLIAPLLLVSLFICCMTCHGELSRLKPPGEQLTTFYLCISAGGVLGGLFMAGAAPYLFSANYENQIAFLGCLLLLLIILFSDVRRRKQPFARLVWLGACLTALLFAGYVVRGEWRNRGSAVLLVRNFYGALQVEDEKNAGRTVRELSHGTITHGAQFLDPGLRHQPTTYYGRNSGIGLTWRLLQSSGPLRMGIIGLGAGTLAAYGRSGDTLRFYELNPLVMNIAHRQFTYLADCPAHIDVVPGDARLTMSQEEPQHFDILVVDAFSGDAIPVHLLTREAFFIYWRHLKPDGVLVVHISNLYLNLAPVVRLAADEAGKLAWQVNNDADDLKEVYGASYVLVSSRPGFFTNYVFWRRLLPIAAPRHLREWTDDYSSLWQIIELRRPK
ncbi:MAG: fused MFS/spermidine synthase [Acidobacteriaceae bacterium]|nr:fused MFS/spermidine synthase [Acidobacteriaceae bacterium]